MSGFDLHRLPLTGTHLIDASAGTGKTYTISGLVLRLLLEREIAIRDILVVTYTEAATEDLRSRVREKIAAALKAFEAGSEEPLLAQLVKDHPEPHQARDCLASALRDFDEAAIFTIHGFCHRILRENSLEAGAVLEAELLKDERPLLQEIVEDYWRQLIYQGPAVLVQYLAARLSPAKLLALVTRHLHTPHLQVLPEPQGEEALPLAEAERQFREAFQDVQEIWPVVRDEVEAILTEDPGLNRNRYRPASIPSWLEAMDGLCAAACPAPELFRHFDRFTASCLAASLKKGSSPPSHRLFDLCETLQDRAQTLNDLLHRQLLAAQSRLFPYVRRQLALRKQRLGVYSFDDLLHQVHRGLHQPGGAQLARAINRRYPAALIDEFQDTDPVQYEIFSAIYRDGGCLLFLIGDPKQAIYSFRGADVFAYLQATREVESRYGLTTNWRSAPQLVQAVNHLFARPGEPFVFEEIRYAEVTPAPEKEHQPLRLEGAEAEPLQLWFVERPAGQAKPLAKEEAQRRILAATAGEIVRLLRCGREKKAILGTRPVEAGDIAVLVRTNREARLFQEVLTGCGVPSVLHSTETLFITQEAAEVERLLAAVAEPGDEAKVRLALATALLGCDGQELADYYEDEDAWEHRLLRFREYQELWRHAGFIRMFRRLLSREEVRSRLLALPDGERRLTNVLHLMEVLHRAALAGRLGMAGLLKFLADRRHAGQEEVEEYLLRLESDADRVKIVTIHKAKGLEFPIVFCPFCWQGSRIGKTHFSFHQADAGSQKVVLDLGSSAAVEHRRVAQREELAENLRLVYVALTRASERCYLAWGAFNGGETSALAYLFHRNAAVPPSERLEATAARVKEMTDQEFWEELEPLAAEGGGIGLTKIGEITPGVWEVEPAPEGALAALDFTGNIVADWRIASYSGLLHANRLQESESPDRDSLAGPTPVERAGDWPGAPATAQKASLFDFPRGAAAGNLLHDILEHAEYSDEDLPAREQLVRAKLAAHGYDEKWAGVIMDMLAQVFHTQLAPGQPDFNLFRLSRTERLHELEFYFPLTSLSAADLRRFFVESGKSWAAAVGNRLECQNWPPLQGFLKGFIDLVFVWQDRFYLVDWKSNHLGDRIEEYHQDRLSAVMAEELYILQYHFYTLALHRYLASRLPAYCYETHFGGVLYLFVRGMAADRGAEYGIYRDRPSLELIEKLETLLAGETFLSQGRRE